MRFLLLLLVAAIGVTIVLLAIRSSLRVEAELPPSAIDDVRWRVTHASREGVTHIVVRREVTSTGRVLEERIVTKVPDDDADYDTKFAEAITLARARAQLYDVEER